MSGSAGLRGKRGLGHVGTPWGHLGTTGYTHGATGEGSAGAVLNDAHAEAGQAPGWFIPAQVEVVGTACGTVGTLHIGLGARQCGDIALSPLPGLGTHTQGSPCSDTAHWHHSPHWCCHADRTGIVHRGHQALRGDT